MIPALSFPLLMALFAGAAGVVIVCSLRATGLADMIADRTPERTDAVTRNRRGDST